MQYIYTTSAGDLAYQRATHDELLTTFTTADPQIILRYFTHNTAGSGAYYDGFTVISAANVPNLPADAMCYLSTGFSAKPHIEDLTAAQFVPRSAYEYWDTNPRRWHYNNMNFPFDAGDTCVGSFVIPKSAYSGTNEIYAYLWLPSPELADDLSANYNVDLTMLAPDSVGVEVMKFSATLLNDYILNETVVSAIHSANCYNFEIGSGEDVQSQSFYHVNLIEDSLINYSLFNGASNNVTANVDTIRNCKFAEDFGNIIPSVHVGLLENCGTIKLNGQGNFSAATVSACDFYINEHNYSSYSNFINSNVYVERNTLLNTVFPRCKYTNCNVTLTLNDYATETEYILQNSNFTTNFTNQATFAGYVSANNSTLNITGSYVPWFGVQRLSLVDSTATLVSNSQYAARASVSATRSYINGTYYEAYTGTL